MLCEICGKDHDLIFLLPLPQEGGHSNTQACLECARKTSVFCQKHDISHTPYFDGFAACGQCIDEQVAAQGKTLGLRLLNGITVSECYFRLYFGPDKWRGFRGWLTDGLTGEDQNLKAGRAVVTAAMKRGLAPEEVISTVIRESNPDILLPLAYRST